MNNKKIKILSLNGGGVRGLFTISVLAEFERIIQRKHGQDIRAGEYFDLIAGTSIGGILALGLAKGCSARELEGIFKERAPLIFPSSRLPKMFKDTLRAFAPLYKSDGLKKAIVEMIGRGTSFQDLDRRVMVPAVNLSTGKPQFFKTPHNPEFTRDGSIKLVDAALATSAAPTFFAPHYCEDLSSYFADGGLCANNPSFVGLHEVLRDMRSDFPNAEVADIHILNVGTLGEEYTVSPKSLSGERRKGYMNLWGMGERLVLTTMTANQLLHKSMLQREMRSHDAIENYVYIDDKVPNEAACDITLDNASESSLQNLSSRGKQIATEVFANDLRVRSFFEGVANPFTQRTNEDQ